INPAYPRSSKVLGATKLTTFLKVTLPATLPYILTGAKLGFGTSWREIVGAEIVSASAGLGYMIDNGRKLLQGDHIIAGMIIIASIGYITEKVIFGYLERKTIKKWGMK